MNLPYQSRLFRFSGLILVILVWLANSSNPPTGRTGAPFDGSCNNCHSGGSFTGSVVLDGLPSTIEPNTTYPLTITLTATGGTPSRGGYQLVMVDGNNLNAGDLSTISGNTQSGTEFFSGREYMEQRGGKVFTGGTVSWAFNWKSPLTANGNTIKAYFIGNFCNGNNNDNGDIAYSFSETYSFAGLPPVSAVMSDVNPASCNGGNNGSATVEASGGATPYTYLWSNGQNGQTAVNLTAGTYTVTVTGAAGSGTATATAAITQPPVLNASASVAGVLTCINLSVMATASASGGTGPYTFEWSNGLTGSPVQLTDPGGYTVTATDANGCTKTASVTVLSNTIPPNATAGPAATLTCAQPTATLNGAGSSQGPTFTYLWTASNGGNIVSGATTLTPLVNAAGTYTLVVTNTTNGCTQSASTTATSDIQPPTATATGGQLTCTNGTVTLQIATNANNPTFSWSGPAGFSSNQQMPPVSTVGTYTVTVTNTTTGCTNSATAAVTQNTTPPTAAVTAETLTCADTLAQITATTNANPAAFAWSGPNGFSSTVQNPVGTVAGTYTVTVTSGANGCTNTATVSVAQNITPPTAAVSAETLTCADTLAQITTTTNANPATFAWSGPNGFASVLQNPQVAVAGNYTVTVTNGANGCTNTALATVNQNTTPPVASIAQPGNLNCQVSSLQLNGTPSSQGPNFDYLWTTANGNILEGDTTLTPTVDAAGVYNLLVVNTVNGCTATSSVTVVQSPAVTAGVNNVVNVSCNGGQNGAATAIGGGGFGNFTYDWSNGDTTALASNLAPGTYVVTVTDGENCTATAMATITQPPVLNANATATGETASGANDGTATANPSGGTPAYTYLWSTGETTATIINLAPGNYTVTATDANGCTAVQVITVNSFNCTISASATTTNVTCNGAGDGTATVTLIGAALPATFLWSNGDTTATATNLAPGTYTVEIADANNCPAELSVQISGPAVLLANVTATNESGVGLNNGTATAQPTGGTAPFSYLWSNNATTQTITGLAPGQYTVTVTDANDCTAVQTVTVNAFGCNLAATISALNVLCNGGNTGQATAIPSGGANPISYLWSNGGNAATISNLSAGTYTVTISDGAGCQTVSATTITQPSPLVAQIEVTPTSCPESKDGGFSPVISGGTPPYQFFWTGGGFGQNLGVGTYSITITDANACTILETATITSNDTTAPGIVCPVSVVGCAGADLQYSLPGVSDNCSLGGAQPELISGLPSGSNFPVGESVQVFRVTDVSGNTSTCSFSVTVGPPIEIVLDSKLDDTGNSGVGSIQVTTNGGVGSLNFSWEKDGQPFATTEDLNNLMAGVYTLTVVDQNGCARTLSPVTIDNLVSTSEPGAIAAIRIVPNPASQFIRLEMQGVKPVIVQILDAKGRLLRTVAAAEWQGQIEVATLPSGLHYVQVLDEQGRSLLVKWLKAE
jgi:hypothetical protein